MVSKIKRQQVALHVLKVMGLDNFVGPDDVPMWTQIEDFLPVGHLDFVDAVRCIYDSNFFNMAALMDSMTAEEAQAILLGLTMLLPIPSASEVVEV